MNEPSIESSSDIPAANRIGRHRIAYHGRPAPAAPPASTSSATSVAVSNPSPNSTPIGYICRGLVTVLVSRPRNRFIRPRLFSCSSSCVLVVAARLHLAEHLDDPEQDHDVDRGDHVEEGAGDERADPVGHLVQVRAVVLDRPVERADADREQEREREHDRRVPEREPEADAQRALALAHQLARRVVDRRDVVGVERVPQPERVRRHADPDRERPRRCRGGSAWARRARSASGSRPRGDRRRPAPSSTASASGPRSSEAQNARRPGRRWPIPTVAACTVSSFTRGRPNERLPGIRP